MLSLIASSGCGLVINPVAVSPPAIVRSAASPIMPSVAAADHVFPTTFTIAKDLGSRQVITSIDDELEAIAAKQAAQDAAVQARKNALKEREAQIEAEAAAKAAKARELADEKAKLAAEAKAKALAKKEAKASTKSDGSDKANKYGVVKVNKQAERIAERMANGEEAPKLF